MTIIANYLKDSLNDTVVIQIFPNINMNAINPIRNNDSYYKYSNYTRK